MPPPVDALADGTGRVERVLQRMLAVLGGDRAAWRDANLELRDAMVDHAARTCPYYRNVAPPGTPFSDIPILTKQVIRERHDDLLSEAVPAERRVASKTSGSTDGVPLHFMRDAAQGPLEYDAGRRFLLALEGIPADATMVWVATRPAPFPGVSTDGDPPGLIPVPTLGLRRRDVRRLFRRLRKLDRWYLYGHVSALARIAEIARGGRSLRPLAVVTTAETLTPDTQRTIEDVFVCPVHSWYGSNEFNGFVMGTEPGARRYVYNPFLVHIEVLDEHGNPTDPGAMGRLVMTDLNNYAMPFLRYDTGDLAIADDPEAALPRVGEIQGRSSEVLVLEGGVRLTPILVGWKLFIDHDLGRHVRAWQCAQVDQRTVELRIVWRDGRRAEAELISAMREVTGERAEVRVRAVEELERLPSGKTWVLRRMIGPQTGGSDVQTPHDE
ncbi:MAG TPA: hypothetical protein VF097_09035 [Actinomycetota bacterium]